MLTGIGAAVLAWLAGRHIAEAVLLGIGVAAAAAAYFNRVIDSR